MRCLMVLNLVQDEYEVVKKSFTNYVDELISLQNVKANFSSVAFEAQTKRSQDIDSSLAQSKDCQVEVQAKELFLKQQLEKEEENVKHLEEEL